MTDFEKGHIPWNKGLNKDTDERVLQFAIKKRKQVELVCNQCKNKYFVNEFRKDKSHYCSRKCYSLSLIGKSLSPETQFKKGHTLTRGEDYSIDDSGYRRKTINGKHIREHNIIWMQVNRFYSIPKGMVVHHRDLNKLNNHPENLVLIDNSTHIMLHHYVNKLRGVC
jgi:hypothetical protein